MKEFITADTHFTHNNIIEFEGRPFETVKEMDDSIIDTWNKAVSKDDIVYHLGDVCFGGKKRWRDILSNLNGRIILIQGNHDDADTVKAMYKEGLFENYYPVGTILKRHKMSLYLTHYPLMIGDRKGRFSVHGHIHSESMETDYHMNLGMDNKLSRTLTDGVSFGYPVPMDNLVKHLKDVNHIRNLKINYLKEGFQ